MKTKFALAAILAACILYGCKPKAPVPNTSTPPFIIDTHTHYMASDAWEKEFIDTYTKHNAMACLMVEMKDLEKGILFAKAHPDRIIPYAAIDIDSPTVLEDIRKVNEMGYRGLGELFAVNQWNYDDPRYEPMWSLAEELGMPVAPHTGILAWGQMARMQPEFLAEVAYRHRKLIIHAAHFGNPSYAEAAEATRRNPNLYFDMSGSSLIKKDHDPGHWEEWLWWTPHIGKSHMPADAVPAFEKILFASDEDPDQLEANIIRFNKMLDACNVADSSRAKSYGLTMAKIHGIKVPGTE
jgi:predicted TIM-barrel fold metal-dependent hydrolase